MCEGRRRGDGEENKDMITGVYAFKETENNTFQWFSFVFQPENIKM